VTKNAKEPENDEAFSDLSEVAAVALQRRWAKITQAWGAKAPR